MKTLNETMVEYKRQLNKGDVRIAYRGLMEFMMQLRAHLSNKYPDSFVSGSIYQGYMDMTYFSFTPQSLRDKKLKIAIVFLHDDISFEVWLCGVNKQVQKKYWNLVKNSGWNQYRIPASIDGLDSIIEHAITGQPDFDNPEYLSVQIENGALEFINEVLGFLSKSKVNTVS